MRYDLISPRARKDGKTFWVKVGAGFARDKGGFSLSFDALPLPDAEGKVTVLMTEPKEQGQNVDPRRGDYKPQPRMDDMPDDTDLPF
jgi:hypothetical protein